MVILIAVLIFCVMLSLGSGAVKFSASEYLSIFSDDSISQLSLIVFELRLPRAILTTSIGALLAMSGAVMQGLFRNPLADPSLIGVTAGGSLGASLMIFLGLSLSAFSVAVFQISFTVLGASVGGGLSVYLIYQLSTRAGRTSVVTMLLCGIALTALVGGINNLMLFFTDSETLRRMSLWRMGSLEGASYGSALFALCLSALTLILLMRFANTLNAFLLGESEARHLGIQVERAKKIFICTVAVATGCAVALAGTVAFVGLIVPHFLRLILGPDHRLLLPACAVGGSILLVVADTFARVLIAPTELPVGLLTALVGAPIFILLLLKSKSYSL